MIFKKILAIKFRTLGDTVLLTAPLLQVKKHFPQSKIHVAVTSTWAPILKNHPAVDKIWEYQRREETAARAKAITLMALKLRKEKYDLVLNFHASPSSSMLAFSTGAKVRAIHFHGHQHKNRYSTLQIPGKGEVKPNIERDMDVIRALNKEIPKGLLPQIFLTPQEVQTGEDRVFQKLKLKRPLLSMGLGASRVTKMWPVERYAEIALRWCKEKKGSVLALGSPDEISLVENFLSKTSSEKNQIQAITDLSLRELASVLKASDLFVGNDSGPKHMAIAVGIPTVSLIGPEHPFEWHPYPREKHPYFFIEDLACRRDALPGNPPWCSIPVCIEENHKCMLQIQPDDVFNELTRICPTAESKPNPELHDQ